MFPGPGVRYSELSPTLARQVRDFPLSTQGAHVPAAAEAELYLLVNTAGTAHHTHDLDLARQVPRP